MVYLNDKSLLNNHEDIHNRSLVTLLILDKHGEHRFKLLKKYTTADMWGVRLTFENGRDKPSRFLEGVQNLKLEIVEAQGPVDKGHDPEIKHFTFVKGRLDSENRVADRHQSDS